MHKEVGIYKRKILKKVNALSTKQIIYSHLSTQCVHAVSMLSIEQLYIKGLNM